MPAAKTGCVTVVLNWRLQVQELDYILNNCKASFLLYDEDFEGPVNQLRDTIPVKFYVRKGGQGPNPEFESALSQQPESGNWY